MKTVTAKACGKFILLGEHFVVTASSPALAFPVPEFRTAVNLELSEKDEFYFETSDRQLAMTKKKMKEALNTIRPLFKAQELNFKVHSTTNFPIQKGFGSSASFAVALSKALAECVGDEKKVVPLAIDAIEALFHKTPSGVDTTTIFHEKPIRFEKGKGAVEIQNRACDFILVDGGERKGCRELVSHVQEIRENNSKLWEQLSGRMRNIVEAVHYSLGSGDVEEVAYAVRQAQDVLATLKLSTPSIEKIIKIGESEGALAGKVSGGGGGGAVVLATRKGEGKEIAQRIQEKGVPPLTVV